MYEDAGLTIHPELNVPHTINGQPVLLSHYPYLGDSHSQTDRYADVRAKDEGLPIIHGHVHGSWHIRGRQYNVGVDVNNFTPVPETTIADWLDTLPPTQPHRRNKPGTTP